MKIIEAKRAMRQQASEMREDPPEPAGCTEEKSGLKVKITGKSGFANDTTAVAVLAVRWFMVRNASICG